jgi:hypothetical protein
MTPSFGYSIQQKNHSSGLGNDVDFSPLSSPAILPHRDRTTAHRIAYPSSSNVKDISENQIREEYEQLEQAKLLITKKLSELQKKQTQTNDRSETFTMASNYLSMSESSRSMDQNGNNIKIQYIFNDNFFFFFFFLKKKGSSNYMNIDYNSFQNVNNNPAKPSQSNYANTLEPATPASLMNMKPSNNRQQRFSTQVKQNTTNHSFSSPSIKDHHPVLQNGVISPLMTPNTTVLQAPLPPTLSLAKSSGKHSRTATKNEKIKGKSTKKPRRESHIESKTIHASPRALKPLLISPTLQPGPSTTATKSVHSFEDAEKILATKSNYQNLMEGKAAALGIAFSTQIKSGLEVRRTAHKAAEQKRRDSLKEWFDRLRKEVEDGYVKRQSSLMSQVIKAQRLEDEEEGIDSMKPLSKVLLLQYAYEYISSLKETLSEKDSIIDEYKKKTS